MSVDVLQCARVDHLASYTGGANLPNVLDGSVTAAGARCRAQVWISPRAYRRRPSRSATYATETPDEDEPLGRSPRCRVEGAPVSPRDGGGGSETATQAPQREAVRDLHAPDALSGSLRCLGCDSEGWEAEPPDWPCRTARLVYSHDEITDIVATYVSWSTWIGAAQYRARLASGWTFADDMAAALERGLRQRLVAERLFAPSDADRALVGRTVRFAEDDR